jgi:tetratricopeptide (TPR) repeat protein
MTTSRSLWLALCLVGIVGVTAGVHAQQDTAAGDAALARFDLSAALTAYRAAHTKSPTDYEATWKLARSLTDWSIFLKDPNQQKRCCIEAEELARSAVKLNPDDSKGHTYLAVAVGKLALYEGGKRKVSLAGEVKTEAERAIRRNNKEDVAYHVLGVWNREMAELNWFLRKFAELIYGKFPSASIDDAIHDLERATELAPTIVPHRVELGITLASARRWPEANDNLEKALAMPKAWVTDDYYWNLARQNLARVKPHLH